MQAEYLVFYQSRHREIIEQLGKVLPDVSITILPKAFIIEAVYLGNLSAFMITTQNCDSILEAEFERDQKGNRLYRVVTSIHIVAHEEVVSGGRSTPNSEQLHKIMKLTVNVTADGNRAANGLHIRFLHEDLPCLVTQRLHVPFR